MRFFTLLFAALLIAASAYASKGSIIGKISDEKTGEAIIGATVSIKDMAVGTATDVDGNFRLEVESGTYTVLVNYIGYTPKEISDVKVTENTSTKLNVVLGESNATKMQEVVVRATFRKENVNALYMMQKNMASISNGISADVIQRTPDRNTGEVLKRVSGASIQNNKFVIVRGLSDRYNIALVDNAVLPSTEPNRKAFSFDIIPSSLIDNITITKAATPDLPGDFAGGAINISTKEVPDDNFAFAYVGGEYNTYSTGQKFQTGYHSPTDILGFDNGARQLPTNFYPSKKIERGLTQQQSNTGLSMLNNNFSVTTRKASPGAFLQGGMGRVYRMKNGRNKLGFTGAVTYSHQETRKKNLIRQYDGYDYTDNVYRYFSNLGGMLNGGYYFGNSKIVFKSMYNRLFEDNFLYRTGTNNSSLSQVRYYAFDLMQKSLMKTSLEGEHKLKNGGKFGWLGSYNIVTNNRPDQRKVSYSKFSTSNTFQADNTTIGKSNNRLFGNLNEKIWSGTVHYTQPFRMFHQKSSVKVGLYELHRHRDFNNRYLGGVLNVTAPNQDGIRQSDIANLYSPELIQNSAYRLEEITIPGDEYQVSASTSAAYVMFDNNLSDKMRLVWGTRFESYHLDLLAGDGTHVQPTWNDLMPSANFTYKLTDKTNFRASYFRSVARPELREVAPLSYYNYDLNATMQGNPNLTRSRIDNIDLRYEVYPRAGEVLSASVFYKHFDQTIENSVNGQNSGYQIQPINYPSARNIGIELEIRKNLDFISGSRFFKNLNFYSNFAYINSKVILDSFDFANGHKYSSRPLSGQSPYVINASLSYSAFKDKVSFNVLYNKIGERIFLVGQGRFGHVYENSRNLLDLQVNYKISKHSEIRFTAKDILNNPVRMYFDQNNSGKFEHQDVSSGTIDPNKDWIYSQYRPGTTFRIIYYYNF